MKKMSEVEIIKKWLGTGSINIFGPPFSGKDTQGQRFAKFFGAALIGGGDILRSRRDIPENVRKTIDAGRLAPTNEYLEIVTPYLAKPEFSGRPLVLSSVGRWHGEEETIIKAASKANHDLKAVVFLSLDEIDIRKRWSKAQETADRGQRADDAAEILNMRLQEFATKTLPVIDFYRKKGLLVEVDGRLPPDEVTTEILTSLVDFSVVSRV